VLINNSQPYPLGANGPPQLFLNLPSNNSGIGFYPLPDESNRHPHISLFTTQFIIPFTTLGTVSGFLRLVFFKINIYMNFSLLRFILYALPI
jgi:hypothetical protein